MTEKALVQVLCDLSCPAPLVRCRHVHSEESHPHVGAEVARPLGRAKLKRIYRREKLVESRRHECLLAEPNLLGYEPEKRADILIRESNLLAIADRSLDLGIDGTQGRVGMHHNFVRSKREKRCSAECAEGNENSDP